MGRPFIELLRERRELNWRPANLGDSFLPRRTAEAAEALRRKVGNLEPRKPRGRDLEEAFVRIERAWRNRGSLGGVGSRDLRLVPWLLFYPPRESKRWLGSDSGFIQAIGRWLEEGGREIVTISLLREFLFAYPREIPTFEPLRNLLERRLENARLSTLRNWQKRCDRYLLLDKRGPERLAKQWLESGRELEEFLAAAGFQGRLVNARLLEAASRSWLHSLSGYLRSGRLNPWSQRASSRESVEEGVNRNLSWLEKDGRLRFESLRKEAAEELLNPFSERRPHAEIEAALRAALLRWLGDPRAPRRPGWAGVPEPTRQILCRWLVGLALDDFFRLISETALDRHWRYRKTFWNAYLERDFITDAWIALGRETSQSARRMLESGERTWAELQGPGVQANHSVLLLRIGGVTVAEWSHSGSCRFWLEGNRNAPKLYQERYTRQQLMRGEDHPQPHWDPVRGLWQKRARSWIEDQTGISVPFAELMPR